MWLPRACPLGGASSQVFWLLWPPPSLIWLLFPARLKLLDLVWGSLPSAWKLHPPSKLGWGWGSHLVAFLTEIKPYPASCSTSENSFASYLLSGLLVVYGRTALFVAIISSRAKGKSRQFLMTPLDRILLPTGHYLEPHMGSL